jgi:hypothetical protein
LCAPSVVSEGVRPVTRDPRTYVADWYDCTVLSYSYVVLERASAHLQYLQVLSKACLDFHDVDVQYSGSRVEQWKYNILIPHWAEMLSE